MEKVIGGIEAHWLEKICRIVDGLFFGRRDIVRFECDAGHERGVLARGDLVLSWLALFLLLQSVFPFFQPAVGGLYDGSPFPRLKITPDYLMAMVKHMEHVGHDMVLDHFEQSERSIINPLHEIAHYHVKPARIERNQAGDNG